MSRARGADAVDPAIRPVLRAALLTNGGAIGPALAMTSLDRDTALLLLSDAEDAGALRMGPGAITWVAPRVARALWQDVDDDALTALHRGLAAALPEGSEEALRHAAVGAVDHDEALAVRLAARAEERMARMGSSEAAELATMAARLTPPERRPDRLAMAGRYAAAAGQLAVAERLLGEARRTGTDPEHRARTTGVMARLWLLDGRMTEANGVLQGAAEEVAGSHPALAALLDSDRTLALCLLGRAAEARTVAGRALEAVARTSGADSGPVPDTDAVEAAAAATAALTGVDAGLDRTVLDGLIDRVPVELQPDPRRWMTVIGLAQALVLGGQPARGARLLEGLIRVGRRTGAPTLTVLPLTMLAEASIRVGRWDLAARQLSDARRAELRMRDRPWVVHLLALPARMAAARGDVATARAMQEEARAGLVEPLPGLAALLDAAEGVAAMAADEPTEALAAFARVDRGGHGSLSPEVSRHHLDHVLAALAVGDADRAADVVDRLGVAARTVRSPWPAAVLPGLRAVVAGDPAGVAVAADDVLAVDPWAAARLHLSAAEHGVTQAAAPAAEGFRALQATRWQRRAVALLDRGQPSVQLTPRQQELVEAVARGRTNAEIAQDLGLRPQSVANHLSRIYRLVGVRSRTELARRGLG